MAQETPGETPGRKQNLPEFKPMDSNVPGFTGGAEEQGPAKKAFPAEPGQDFESIDDGVAFVIVSAPTKKGRDIQQGDAVEMFLMVRDEAGQFLIPPKSKPVRLSLGDHAENWVRNLSDFEVGHTVRLKLEKKAVEKDVELSKIVKDKKTPVYLDVSIVHAGPLSEKRELETSTNPWL